MSNDQRGGRTPQSHSTELVTSESRVPVAHGGSLELFMPPEDIKNRIEQIHALIKAVMKEGVDYGRVPGTQKKSLWKPGAEKIKMMLGISVKTTIVDRRITDDEASFTARAVARMANGRFLGAVERVCSTDEEKYRWRGVVHHDEYVNALPQQKRMKYKKDGKHFEQVRHNSGDLHNTIIAMAQKRASVALVGDVTGASAIFENYEGDGDPGAGKDHVKGGDVFVTYADVDKTGTKTGGGTWTRYKIELSDDRYGTTFTEELYSVACQAKFEESPVKAEIKADPKYPGSFNVLSIVIVPPPANVMETTATAVTAPTKDAAAPGAATVPHVAPQPAAPPSGVDTSRFTPAQKALQTKIESVSPAMVAAAWKRAGITSTTDVGKLNNQQVQALQIEIDRV